MNGDNNKITMGLAILIPLSRYMAPIIDSQISGIPLCVSSAEIQNQMY